MPISFNCQACGKGFKVAEAHAGRAFKCSACGTAGTVPSVEEAPASEPQNFDWDSAASVASGSGADEYCKRCGATMSGNLAFCTQCGTRRGSGGASTGSTYGGGILTTGDALPGKLLSVGIVVGAGLLGLLIWSLVYSNISSSLGTGKAVASPPGLISSIAFDPQVAGPSPSPAVASPVFPTAPSDPGVSAGPPDAPPSPSPPAPASPPSPPEVSPAPVVARPVPITPPSPPQPQVAGPRGPLQKTDRADFPYAFELPSDVKPRISNQRLSSWSYEGSSGEKLNMVIEVRPRADQEGNAPAAITDANNPQTGRLDRITLLNASQDEVVLDGISFVRLTAERGGGFYRQILGAYDNNHFVVIRVTASASLRDATDKLIQSFHHAMP